MIFNNADNIMYCDKEVDRVFYGKNLVWERGNFYWISDRQTQSICGYKGVPTSPVCYLNWNQKPTNVSRPFPSYKLNKDLYGNYEPKNIFGDIYKYEYDYIYWDDKGYIYSLESANQYRDIFSKTNLVINYNNVEDRSYCTEIDNRVFLYGEVNEITFKNCIINSIGHSAFAHFTSYKYGELTLGDINTSITIKDQAFWNCHWEFKISFNNKDINLGKYVFYNSYVKEVVFPLQVSSMEITNCTFEGCEKLEKINLPVGITSIDDFAFSKCILLKDISIPNTVTKIGDYAFSNCSNLISAIFLDGVTEVGHEMFYNCISLNHVELPSSIKQIGQQAFDGCSSLTSIEIPNGVTTIWSWAFQNCISLTEIIIPYGVTEIHNGLFYGCSKLSSIVFPSSISKIGIGIVGKCSDVLDIYYTGTEEQWNTIEKDRYWLDDISGEVNIHCNYNN